MSKRSNPQSNDVMALTLQVGCLIPLASMVIIGAAAAVGYLVDNWLDTGNIFLILAILASFPVTLFAIIRLSLWIVQLNQKTNEETAELTATQEQGE
jgi:F0F1-type ATP synthase assembly protein I